MLKSLAYDDHTVNPGGRPDGHVRYFPNDTELFQLLAHINTYTDRLGLMTCALAP